MEVAKALKTLVNLYHTTKRYNPEDRHLCINQTSPLEHCHYHSNNVNVQHSLNRNGIRCSIVSTAVLLLLNTVQTKADIPYYVSLYNYCFSQ
jgi:hypothetical protein